MFVNIQESREEVKWLHGSIQRAADSGHGFAILVSSYHECCQSDDLVSSTLVKV